ATVYTRGVSYVSNGDQINLRHLSAPETGMQTDTILSVGGWSAPNTPAILTGSPTRATFSSVTVGTPTGALNPNGCVAAPEDNGGSTQPPTLGEPPTDPAAGNGTALPDVTPVARSGGGGITGWLSLALLALAGIRRQRHA
ncbi:MAG: GlyGly-CTERM sorting domain-containing protein, partial [Thiotrichales bacterium]